ncbi:MAG: glycoside hydrolase family 3 C-terminal domain-containing protein [Phaeodactylibacter sp.]|nr:glycoside hydrolase family 3 C-terminal domain-containing protein [Phaeodactylibacter sp.]MCB9277070.1 glycoside hydrolase family 3 C-terminal domain-containing protein [Lewinellaceae bacterium]
MKKYLAFVLFTLLAGYTIAQPYPFQNINLSDDERLDNLVSLMTLEEKLDNLSPRLPGVPRLGVKGTRIVEGLHGLAYSGPANWAVKGEGEAPTTTFPQAIGLAQMWDPALHEQIAAWEAYEARFLAQNQHYGKAGLIVLAPNADLGRDIRWGRTEECYGEDAYLASVLTVAYVKGLQGPHPRYWRTASLMKHFLANSNENNRFTNSSDFDEQLFREYYAYAFYKGVTEGGSRAFMAAYNKHNGIPCHVHPMLRDITVDEWGQNGIICTDGGGLRRLVTEHRSFPDYPEAAAACIKAGISMFLDQYKPSLQEALDKGLVSEEAISHAVRSNLRVMLKLGLLDNNRNNPYAYIGIRDTIRPWMKPEAMELARKATRESIVLLKNDGLLPLNKGRLTSVAVIGPSADLVVSDWYSGTPPYRVSVLEGIRNAVGENVAVHFAASNKADSAIIAARGADVAIVCIGSHPLSYGLGWGQNYVASDGREEVDRQAISLEQEDLVKLVLAANPNTVLVLVSSFPYAIPWAKEHMPAILHITQSSQELGNGIADILFGAESPAGRLVQTWPATIEHLPPMLDYDIRHGRTYMYSRQQPLFPFGHGLSYTSFEYAGIQTSHSAIRDGDVVEVAMNVKNTGAFDSDEVVQLYVSFPDSKVERPMKALKGFRRIHIHAGESRPVTIPLDSNELKYWDEAQHAFVLEPGRVQLLIGASSEDIRLRGELVVE